MNLSSLFFLAAETGADVSLLQGGWAQLGAFALIIGGLIWFVRYQMKRSDAQNQLTLDEKKRLEEDNRRLYDLMATQFMPALTKATAAVAASTELLTDIRTDRRLEEVRRQAREDARRDTDGR